MVGRTSSWCRARLLVVRQHCAGDRTRIYSLLQLQWDLLRVVGGFGTLLSTTGRTTSRYGVILRPEPRKVMLVRQGFRPFRGRKVGFSIEIWARQHQIPCISQVRREGVVLLAEEGETASIVVMTASSARRAEERVVHAANPSLSASQARAWLRTNLAQQIITYMA